MVYDIATVKANILEYRKCNNQSEIEIVDTSINEFFSFNPNVTINEQNLNVENHEYINNLIDEINIVATDREFTIFWLFVNGRELKDIGKIFKLSSERVRQIYEETLIKLP